MKNIIVIPLLALSLKVFFTKLLPYGKAIIQDENPLCQSIDHRINNLSIKSGKLKKIYQRGYYYNEISNAKTNKNDTPFLLKGPETVIFDNKGRMYSLTEDANLIRFDNISPADEKNDNGILLADITIVTSFFGRPLGGKFVPKNLAMGSRNVLYFANAVVGLCRVDIDQPNPKVEIVASRVQLSDGSYSPIYYADDLDIGPKTGHVYFTDASDIIPDLTEDNQWDTMSAYKLDLLRGKPSGRLLRYKPESDEIKVIADGIAFANGVAVDKDETFVMISETNRMRALKYHLIDKKVEVIIPHLVAIPDGADCSFTTKLCYLPLPSPCPSLLKIIYSQYMPSNLSAWIRTLLSMLPQSLTPKPVQYGGIVEIWPGGIMDSKGNVSTRPMITNLFQDPKGLDISLITGVTEYKGKLYLGSLHNDYIGVYDVTK